MFSNQLMLLAFGMLTLARAQYNSSLVPLPTPNLNNTAMNITFSVPSASDCGRVSTSQNDSATIVIRRPSSRNLVCMDLDYVFTNPNVTFAPPSNTTPYRDEFDGVRYTIGDSTGWAPDAFNYSQVFYTQRRSNVNGEEDSSLVGNIMLRAYNETGCPGSATNVSAGEWYSWNCANEDGSCNVLPFSVRSILIGFPDGKYSVGEKGCVAAVEFNAGSKTRAALHVLANAVFGVALFMAF